MPKSSGEISACKWYVISFHLQENGDVYSFLVPFLFHIEIHAAAKETVALAEKRFMSNSHEWQFDNAWQEMLNHATAKVMDAENKKAESHAEHQRKAQAFNAAELKVMSNDCAKFRDDNYIFLSV